MGRHKIDVQATTTASPGTVYALLRDGASWPTWSPIDSFSLQREGAGEREGLGALRLFTTGRTRSLEEIVELIPDRRLSYELRSGLPLRGYRADVDLEPAGDGGTTIYWRSSFDAKIPGTGWFYRLVLAKFIGRTARGLAAYAAEQVAAYAAGGGSELQTQSSAGATTDVLPVPELGGDLASASVGHPSSGHQRRAG